MKLVVNMVMGTMMCAWLGIGLGHDDVRLRRGHRAVHTPYPWSTLTPTLSLTRCAFGEGIELCTQQGLKAEQLLEVLEP